ncbi:MAG: hypothetical protein K0R65_1033 [Crocinitomicaceae bacterium]|jgi:hypothetical protein|nr:hypothetical protein [Crocinitomicaceae bacterium]
MEKGVPKENKNGIDYIPGPDLIRLEKLELPLPPEIERGKLESVFPKMHSLSQINVNFPKMISRDERYNTNRFSSSDISRALKLSEAELYMSILGSEQKLRYKFFGRLDKLFRDGKSNGIRRTIRKRNE